ncbi:MAG: glycosyltransferase family 39 protein [Thermotogota bacterium]|nr:glycosyltransferase family 39 protein [Thermotogota bacterium]
MKLDSNKFVKIIGLIGIGVLLVLAASFFITPLFVANHFSLDGILAEGTIRRIQSVRFSAVVLGIFAVVFGALIYIYPSTANRCYDFVSLKGERFQTRHFYLPFCFACFFIALTLGLLITQSGSGISPDSTNYISAGENIYYGNGFHVGYSADSLSPYTVWPPLYPLSIAGFMHLGFNAEQAARIIPILCFAFLMFHLFFIGKVLDGVFVGYIACLTCLVFTPLLWVTSFAWTEMPYIFFSVLAILFLIKFGRSNNARNKMLCASALFTALAILTRYIGITLLVVGLIVIVLKSKSRLKKMVYQILLFGCISFFPIILWVYRNITLTSHLSGGNRGESTIGLLANVNRTVRAILNDFLGPLSRMLFNNYAALTIVAALFILLVVFAKIYPAKRKVLLEYLRKNYVVFLYIFIYLITLIIMRSMWHFDAIGTRLTCPVYPFLILVVISFILYVRRQIKKSSLKPTLFLIITIFCVLFLVLQAGNSIGFYHGAKDGQGYNSPFWRNNIGIGWVESNVPDNATVYSDRADAIQFRLKRPSRYLPRAGNDKAINEFFETLKNEENSFIIRFKKTQRAYLLSNDEIIEMNQKYDVLVAVADFPESTIYKTKDNSY